MKQSLKYYVVSALKIELAFYTSETKDNFTSIIFDTYNALLIANGNADVDAHCAVANLISTYPNALFKHVSIDVEEFKRVHIKNTPYRHSPHSMPILIPRHPQPTLSHSTSCG